MRLVNLLHGAVNALAFIYGYVVVQQMTVSKVDDLLLGDVADAVKTSHHVAPLLSVDEGINKLAGAAVVVFHLLVSIKLHIVDNRGQQVVREFATLQLLNFAQHQVAHLFQCLALFGQTLNDERRIFGQRIDEGCAT